MNDTHLQENEQYWYIDETLSITRIQIISLHINEYREIYHFDFVKFIDRLEKSPVLYSAGISFDSAPYILSNTKEEALVVLALYIKNVSLSENDGIYEDVENDKRFVKTLTDSFIDDLVEEFPERFI